MAARSTALGHRIDERLEAGDVRLTMGGEPTFVSIDDRDGAEWNIAALGPDEATPGRRAARAAPRPVRPGGPAPLRAGQMVSRRIAAALGALRATGDATASASGKTPSLFADESTRLWLSARSDAGRSPRRWPTGSASTRRIACPATRTSGTTSGGNGGCRSTSILENKLDDPEERRRLAKVFEQGLDQVVGYAVAAAPASRSDDGSRWVSGPWFLRREHMFLIPGDSPMGFRLPLDSLPWATPRTSCAFTSATRSPTASPCRRAAMAAAAPRARADGGRRRDRRRRREHRPPMTARRESARVGPRASFARPCASSRATAGSTSSCRRRSTSRITSTWSPPSRTPRRELQMPVLIEGYPPPDDHRMNQLQGHARPGRHRGQHPPRAHAGTSWSSRPPRSTRRPIRPGWGPRNSCSTAGTPAPAAATTSSSAGRRRPTARSSAGPTCSAAWSPTGTTIRRCRTSSRACSSGRRARRRGSTRRGTTASTSWRSPSASSPSAADCPPWLVDRVFRHLLVDVTGNTHRAEFCIDKLYSPDTAAAVRACVELRALRDAAARADEPGAAAPDPRPDRAVLGSALRPPAGALGDRAARPLRACRTSSTRISTTCSTRLRQGGPAAGARMVRPALRVPVPALRQGQTIATSRVELRQAIEPWHVLGEEAAAGGAARYVDSSVERVQVKVQGMTDTRHVVDLQRPPGPASSDGDERRVRRRRALSRLAAAVVPAPDHPGARAPGLRPGRYLDADARSAAAPIMFRTPAAGRTTRSRSTPTRRRAAGSPASSRSAIRRAR